MKVVLDTNTLISAIFWQGNEFEVLKQALDGKITAYASAEIFKELRAVLVKKFKAELGNENIEIALNDLATILQFVEPMEKINIVKEDPADNKILECAIIAKADFIITGDSHLLKLGNFKSIRVLTAKEFLRETKQ